MAITKATLWIGRAQRTVWRSPVGLGRKLLLSGAFAALLGWGAASMRGALEGGAGWLRPAAVVGPAVAGVAWAVFGVVAGAHDSVNAQAPGPLVAVSGCVLLLGSAMVGGFSAHRLGEENTSENRT